MLTQTQREWAEAQVGTERGVPLEGAVVKATATGAKDAYVLLIEGDEGVAEYQMKASSEDVGATLGTEITVRIEGTVESVLYDEELRRVGLVVVAAGSRVIEWNEPLISREEEAAREIDIRSDLARDEERKLTTDRIHLRSTLLGLLASDEEVRAAVRGIV